MKKRVKDYSERLSMMMLLGVIALVIGGFLITLNWPGTEIEIGCFADDCTVETGSGEGVAFGFAVLGIGQILVLIASVGFGVKNGTLAAAQESVEA